MSKQKKAILGTAGSMKAAAGRMGIRIEVVTAAKNAGCAAIQMNGRTDCDALNLWLKDHPEVVQEFEDGTLTTEKLLDARAIRRTRELKLEVLQNDLMPTDDARMEMARVIIRAKSTLLGGIQSLALKIAADTGGDQIKIAERAKAWAMEALAELADTKWQSVRCPGCETILNP